MAYKIETIEGIGPKFGETLGGAGIKTTDDLLEHCADARGRKRVAAETGLKEAQILKWANMADLMRISGIAGEFAELLKAAGVDTVKELRTRNAENLAAKMGEINAEKKLTRIAPSAATVIKWVEQAKTTEPRISH